MVDQLIEDLIRTGREITTSELQELRQSIAELGFDPLGTARAGTDLAGLVWQGRTVRSNEQMLNGHRHYLRHVILQQEWPAGTTMTQYVASLREAVLDNRGGILIESVHAAQRLTFLSPSGTWRGPGGNAWTLVGYNLGYGYWVTGYQPDEDHFLNLQGSEGPDRRWLQPLS